MSDRICLVIGDRALSSWSMRAWLALRLTGAEFLETPIRLDQPATRDDILVHSPSGLVPVLEMDGQVIWDSLAICEYLAERFPRAHLWPEDRNARAMARCVVAEMHAGFPNLRAEMPMDLTVKTVKQPSEACAADIGRVQSLLESCRRRFSSPGPFLFGRPSIGDCYFAPVVTRFRSYGVTVRPEVEAYMQTVESWRLFQAWQAEVEC